MNNQILDWSFKVDGVLHNATQEQVFDTVATDMVTAALDGYNGKNYRSFYTIFSTQIGVVSDTQS